MSGVGRGISYVSRCCISQEKGGKGKGEVGEWVGEGVYFTVRYFKR